MKNGATIWSTVIEDMGDDPLPGIGGGLALSPEGLVAHAGGRALSLLDPASGDLIWTIEMKIPLRGGPTIIGTTACGDRSGREYEGSPSGLR